jgi:hypothetical protein
VGGAAALVARVGAKRHETVQGVGDIPQPRPGGRGVPVDERPVARADDQVPWGQVVVGDDAGPLGGDEGLPAGIRRRAEAGDRVVEVADEPGGGMAVTVADAPTNRGQQLRSPRRLTATSAPCR